MNSPAPIPSPATPQTTPTAWGVFQSLVTGFLTFKASTALGLPDQYAAPLAAGVASSITSAVHAWAQKLHLSGS